MAKFYATAMPRSVLAEAFTLTGHGEPAEPPAGFTAVSSVGELPFGTDDAQVTTEIDGTRYLDAKVAAMRAHATQIAVHPPFFALSNRIGQRILGREYFTLLAGKLGPQAAGGREADLFAGLPERYV